MLKVAIIEDDQVLSELVAMWLEVEGYHSTCFSDGESFLNDSDHDQFDIILLDWELPGTEGIDVLKSIRLRLKLKTPIIFTTIRDQENDIVMAFDNHADDYIVKPLTRRVLLARIVARLRESQRNKQTSLPEEFTFGDLQLLPGKREIRIDGELVKMTSKDFDLALYLFQNQDALLSREHLLETIWQTSPDITTRTVDTHISRLRKKLSLNKESLYRITTVHSHGYRLEQNGLGSI